MLKSVMLKTAVLVCLCSCSTTDKVPLEEFQAVADSISRAKGITIWIAPNQYKSFGISRKDFGLHKKRLGRLCEDTSCVYVVKMERENVVRVFGRPATLDSVIADYERVEELRRHRKNRARWSEFRRRALAKDPHAMLISRKQWKKQRKLKFEMENDLRNMRKPDTRTVHWYSVDRQQDGSYRSRRVSDSVEMAKMKAGRYRWNTMAGGMLGAVQSDKPFAGLRFGAEGYRLSARETLWFSVVCGKCHPAGKTQPVCEISGSPYVLVRDSSGNEEEVHVKLHDVSFRLLQNPPFKYNFTACFEYAGKWYYVFMCDNPELCVCKPVDTPQRSFPY